MPHKNLPTDVFKSINMHNGDINVCWEWTGKVNKKDGRPYFTARRRRRPAYVVVLELVGGTTQKKKKQALHSCDNPICCNPTHLSWGTHQQNMDDMVKKGRHGLPKIAVRAIKKLCVESNQTQQEIADLYGISREAVSAIDTGRRKV